MKKRTFYFDFLRFTALLCLTFSVAQTLAQPCTNVKDAPFLAKGDGVTDDTEAIRKAFAVATNCVFFPKGIYVINPDSIRHMAIVRSGMTVRGEKNLSVLKLKDGGVMLQKSPLGNLLEQMLLGQELVFLPNGTPVINPLNNIVIKDLIFDANYRGNRAEINKVVSETRALSFEKVTGLAIQNCVFVNAGKACLVFVTCANTVVSDNYFYDVGQGKFNADAIQGNGCFNTKISGNVLENVGEGIFCQHHAALLANKNVGTPDSLSEISNNRISTLDVGEPASIGTYISLATLKSMQLQSILLYDRAGRAIGPGIGVLSNNSKVFQNKILRHNGIAVQAFKLHGNLPTSNVEVRDNLIKENAKVKYFNCDQGQYIRNTNGALVVSAEGQTVKNVQMRNNRVETSFNCGIDLVIAQKDIQGSVFPGVLEDITIENNTLNNTCKDTLIDKNAAVDFRNVGFTSPGNQNRFRNITIRKNQLGYGYKGHGLWLEPCMANVRVLQNTFVGDLAFKFNAASGSCIREIAPLTEFTTAQKNFLQCFLEPGASAIGTCPPNQLPNRCKQCE